MPSFGSDNGPVHQPNTARSDFCTSYALLKALLDQAARQVDFYDRIRLDHPAPFFDYYTTHPIDLGGKSIEHFFRVSAVRLILDRGSGAAASLELLQLRQETLAACDDDPDYDVLALIRKAGARFGTAPLAMTISESEARIDVVRRVTGEAGQGSAFQLVGLEYLDADVTVLRIYLDLARRVGPRGLLSIIGGQS